MTSLNQLRRTKKADLISALLSSQCKAELQEKIAADLQHQVTKLQRQLDAQSIANHAQLRRQGNAANRETWFLFFDHVKRDANPHGQYINARLRDDVPDVNLDIVQEKLLPYARKTSPLKTDAHGHRWVNIYF